MNPVKKKRALSADGDSESNSGSSDALPENIIVDFEAIPPHADDTEGVMRLLDQTYASSLTGVDVRTMARELTSQEDIGMVFKTVLDDTAMDTDEDDEVYGMLTVIPLPADVRAWLEQHCKGRITLPEKEVALILSDRLVNMPCSIAAPSYDSLVNDIQNVNRISDMKGGRKWKCSTYVLVSRAFRAADGDTTAEAQFSQEEEAGVRNIASQSCEFVVPNEPDGVPIGNPISSTVVASLTKPFRSVSVMSLDELSSFAKLLQK